jgi:hypothetical protein
MGRRPRYKLSKGRKEDQREPGRRKKRAGVGLEGEASHHPTDDGLYHEGVLKVADGVAILDPTLVDPWEETEKSPVRLVSRPKKPHPDSPKAALWSGESSDAGVTLGWPTPATSTLCDHRGVP